MGITSLCVTWLLISFRHSSLKYLCSVSMTPNYLEFWISWIPNLWLLLWLLLFSPVWSCCMPLPPGSLFYSFLYAVSYISICPSNCFIPSSSLSSIIFIFRIETLFSFHLSLTVLVLASVIFALHSWSAWCASCSLVHSLHSTAADIIFSPITPQSFLLLSLFILLCCDKNT